MYLASVELLHFNRLLQSKLLVVALLQDALFLMGVVEHYLLLDVTLENLCTVLVLLCFYSDVREVNEELCGFDCFLLASGDHEHPQRLNN